MFDPSEEQKHTRLACSLFFLIWGISEFSNHVAFPSWLTRPFGILRLIGLVYFLMKPSSLWRAFVMIFADTFYLLYGMPFQVNHLVMRMLINMGLLIALFENRIFKLDPAQLMARLKTLIRWELFLLYFFVVLHKLNTDFFNPDVSAAIHLFDEINEIYPWIPNNSFTQIASIYGTLLFEAGIPILLLFRRTRLIGILAGMVFHLLLAFSPAIGVFDFTVLMFALFFLHLPKGLMLSITHFLHQHKARTWIISNTYQMVVFVLGLAALGLSLYFKRTQFEVTQLTQPMTQVGQWFCLPIGFFLLFVYIRILQKSRHSIPTTETISSSGWVRSCIWVIPVITFLHCFSPYLGLRTTPALSMFSNLRTEGSYGNHFFIPPALKVFGYQDDLVQVQETSSGSGAFQVLADSKDLIPYFEFCRMVNNSNQNESITFVRNGTSYTSTLEQLRAPRNGKLKVMERLLSFRSFNPEGPMECRW